VDGRGVLAKAIEYPTRDGKPMGETDQHADRLRECVEVLRDRFAGDPQLYVSGNNFVYYTEGVMEDVVSPDVYVVKGVAKRERDSFMCWKEGGATPCFVLEITSKSTRREDLGDKMAKYRDDLEVPEYFLYDPREEWIAEGLRGYRRQGGEYVRIEPNASGRLVSLELGLELQLFADHLRFFEPAAQEPLPTRAERAERERDRAERAERELKELRAEIERLKRRPGV
jgi:Uma2 family endonuclease